MLTGAKVTAIDAAGVTYTRGGPVERIEARTVLWAEGMRATTLADRLAAATGAAQDRQGRLEVDEYLNLPDHPEVFVVGDLARREQDGRPLPAIAPVAMQQGRWAAGAIVARQRGRAVRPFRYLDKGQMAVIGRHAAVVDFGRAGYGGYLAWLTWLFVHVAYLIEFDNKLRVLLEWAWNYFTRKRGARLITGDEGRCDR